ncbi:MAG: M28 family peptidase [Proteobacteria bacterium]|nr:M28 family peptidase [Pseudomonadota bacterium]
MRSLALALAAFATSAAAQTPAPTPAPAPQPAQIQPAPVSADVQRTIDRLREAGLQDVHGYEIVRDLVSEIGPRLAGSAQEARARDWAVAMLRAARFSNVHIETFPIPGWSWQRQEARIVSPSQQRLVVAALGNSPSTPAGGLEAEIVRFPDLPTLDAAPEAAVRGRIVFIDEHMTRTQDASGYGAAVAKRSGCPRLAAPKGAVACMIRSVGTDTHRFAHQGSAGRNVAIPTASMSPADAETLDALLEHGPVRVHLELETTRNPDAQSGNVIADIRGRERPDEIVLLAAHLDSWDLGQGAIDDGAGVAIITAAARLINALPRHPRRTIRLLLAGTEEPGGLGGDAYGRAHASEYHVIAAESDLGADRVYRFNTHFAESALPYARAFERALAPLGVVPGDNNADGGTDIGAVRRNGAPVVDLQQDASRYFDHHHTADDTLAAIDPEQLRQNVAAYAVFAYLAAESDWDFGATRPAAPAASP